MFFRKNTSVRGVAFDVGTASVSAALFELRPGDARPHVLAVLRKFHFAPLRRDTSHFSKSVTHQFSALLEDVQKFSGEQKPTVFLIGLSAIFYLGKTEHIHEAWPSSRAISRGEVERLIKGAENSFLAGLDQSDVVIFETIPMKSILNGYVIEKPEGKSASELELWVRFGATSRELFDALAQRIKASRPDAHIYFSTFPVSAWELMRAVYFPAHSTIMVDIGSEITEVAFLVDGVIAEVLSLPFGVMNLLMRIAEAERVELENALSHLRAYTGGMVHEKTEDKTRAIIKKEIQSWEENFERVWQEAARQTMADIKMLFLGGGGVIDDLRTAVVPPLLHPDLARGLSSSVVAPDIFRDKFGTFTGFDGPGDFGLMSLIVNYVSKQKIS
ncbi:MAG: hypothetical protein HY470_00145 [Candidatus Ryanbacteria bacterium]|nr:hypothetical protein [Candidatus Ryanbacteria bacterium]